MLYIYMERLKLREKWSCIHV